MAAKAAAPNRPAKSPKGNSWAQVDAVAKKLGGAANAKNADVLMISDFVMGDLDSRTKAAIKTEQERNTCFCSLVVGRDGNENAVACFDRNWFYDAGSPGSSRRLVEQLHAFRTRRDPGGEPIAPGSQSKTRLLSTSPNEKTSR